MRRIEVTIVDYGIGNLLSVRRGLEHCGAKVEISGDPERIFSARRVVLPGVGAFAVGMQELRGRGLDKAVREAANRGTPILGICLGMQMLLDKSDEFGTTAGLGLIPGHIIAVPSVDANGETRKIPHIGWNALILPTGRENWQGTILADVISGESTYFVHSYMACPSNPHHRIANCSYRGQSIAAVISRANVSGCQFHPEKSGETGLRVLRQFLKM